MKLIKKNIDSLAGLFIILFFLWSFISIAGYGIQISPAQFSQIIEIFPVYKSNPLSIGRSFIQLVMVVSVIGLEPEFATFRYFDIHIEISCY